MQVEHELCTRLRIGGKWYGRGDKVMLDEHDAAIYRSRGISKPSVNAEKNQTSIPAANVGLITKGAEDEAPEVKTESPEVKTENTNHGKSRGKGR